MTVPADDSKSINIDPSVAPSNATPSKGAPDPAPTPKPSPPAEGDPAWLAPRLEQAKRSFLKDLGFETAEEAKKLAESKRKAEEANKTEEEKRKDAEREAKKLQKQVEDQSKALSSYAEAQMKALTAEQQAAVKAIAGEDPAQQLTTITALRPTWAGAPASDKDADAGKPPADTAPARSAPKGISTNEAPPDLKAIYEEWKDKNPIWASEFALRNGLFETK